MLRIYLAAAFVALLAFAGAEVQACENPFPSPLTPELVETGDPISPNLITYALQQASIAWGKDLAGLEYAYSIGWVQVTRVMQNGVAYLKVTYAGLELLVVEPI
jgi:hypothetical protein